MQPPAPVRRPLQNVAGRRPVERLERRTLFAAVFWDAGGDGTNWHDPLNWSLDAVPSAEDDVTITRVGTYAVEVTGAAAVARTVSLGGPSGSQTLVLNSPLALTAGLSRVRLNGTLRVPTSLSGGPSVLLENAGRVQVEAATVAVPLSNAGLVVARGASAFTAAATLDNNLRGRVQVEADDASGSTTLTLAGGLANYGTVELISTASAPRDVTLESLGPLTNHDSGVLHVAPAAGAAAGSSGRRVLAGTLVNAGSLRVLHDALLDAPSARHSNSGSIHVEAGSLTVRQSGNAPGFSSSGTVRVAGGDLVLTGDAAPASFNVTGGAVEVFAGRQLTLSGGNGLFSLQRGVLSGRGTVRGSVHNTGGVVAPGPAGTAGSVGSLTVTGSYLQGAEAALQLDAGPFGLDHLATGASLLDGALLLASPGGFDPPADSVFPLLAATSRVGTFASVTPADLSGGRQLAASYFPGAVRAVVVAGDSPPAPDLAATGDSGLSDADDITRDDTPRLTGSAADGTAVEVLADGVPVGSTVATGGRYVIDVATTLADGIHLFTTRLIDGQGEPGPASAPLAVEIDTAGPAVASAAFIYAASPHKLEVTFGEDVGPAVDADDLAVRRLGSGEPAFNPRAVAYDAGARTASFSFTGMLPNGNYQAALRADAVTDVAGNPLAADHLVDFFVLAGDINRDRAVDSSDFARLAGSFGRTGMTYAQGDLNGDGAVDSPDFALLAGNFGRKVPPPAAAVRPAGPDPAPEAPRPAAPVARRRPLRTAPADRRMLRVPHVSGFPHALRVPAHTPPERRPALKQSGHSPVKSE